MYVMQHTWLVLYKQSTNAYNPFLKKKRSQARATGGEELLNRENFSSHEN
jgi:hypothetical protein